MATEKTGLNEALIGRVRIFRSLFKKMKILGVHLRLSSHQALICAAHGGGAEIEQTAGRGNGQDWKKMIWLSVKNSPVFS